MPFPLFPVILAGLTGGAVAKLRSRTRTRKRPPSSSTVAPPPTIAGTFPGQLHQGTLYRVFVTLPADYVAHIRKHSKLGQGQKALLGDIQARLESVGFGQTLLVTQDPTNPNIATAITRWTLAESDLRRDPKPLTLTRVEPVEEPPNIATLAYAPVPACLDEGLMPGEVAAIRAALTDGIDPKHLGGFASTLEPYFPITAGLLRAKAAMIGARSAGSALNKEAQHRSDVIAGKVIAATDRVGWFGKDAVAFATQKHLPAHSLGILSKDLGSGPARGFKIAGEKGPHTWLPLSRVIGIEDALATMRTFRDPKATQVGGIGFEEVPPNAFGETLHKCHPLTSLVPGPGTGVLPMFIAGAALALTLPVTLQEIGEAHATLPAKYKPMFDVGRVAGWGSVFQATDPKTKGMLDSRDQLPEAEERMAFDAGLCLGRAAALQKAGFQHFYLGTRGTGLGPRSGDFARAVSGGGQGGVPVGTSLAIKRKVELEALAKRLNVPLERLEDAVRECVVELLKSPALGRHGALENELGVDSAIASAARSVVREVGDNVRVVDPLAMKTLLPPRGSEHYVSPSALQLAHAQAKPFTSGVTSPEAIRERLSNIGRSITDEGLQAQKELAKAQKVIERRRWVEWWRKQGKGPYKPDQANPVSGGTLTGSQ